VTFVCTALWKIYLRSNLPNLFKIRRVLWKLWRNTFWCVFYAPQCRSHSHDSTLRLKLCRSKSIETWPEFGGEQLTGQAASCRNAALIVTSSYHSYWNHKSDTVQNIIRYIPSLLNVGLKTAYFRVVVRRHRDLGAKKSKQSFSMSLPEAAKFTA